MKAIADCLADGSEIAIAGPLDIAVMRRNPADFDYAGLLLAKGDSGALTLSDPDLLGCLPPHQPPSLLDGNVIARLRERLVAVITRHVSPGTGPLLRALLLGDRSQMEDDVRDVLSRAGLMHLLAVSGLHVLLAGFAAHRFLFSVLIRTHLSWDAIERIRAPVTIGLLVLYAVLTGAAPSVVRAVIMAALLISRTLVRRNSDTINALGAAAVAILVARPEQLFDVGFQLSFAAVGGIVLLAPPMLGRFPRAVRRTGFVAKSISVSLAATIATAPIVAHSFGFLPLSGIVLNVAAVPAASVALASGFLMLLASPVSDALAGFFGATADVAIRLVAGLAGAADMYFPQLAVSTARGIAPCFLSFALVVAAGCHLSGVRQKWRVDAVCIALTAGVLWVTAANDLFRPKRLDVIFLDVGQGDAIVIRTPDQRVVVVDVGPAGRGSSPASRSLIPFLHALGTQRVDVLVVTHDHADHSGGLADVARAVDVGLFLANADVQKEHTPSLGMPSLRVFAGDRVSVGPDVDMHVLGPRRSYADPNINNQSIVLRLEYRDVCMLLTGDIEQDAERALLEAGEHIACDVVKLAHHGSRTSSTWPFVKAATRPAGHERFAIISVGRSNRFGLPDEDVVSRWKSSGWTVLRTDDSAQWVRTDGYTTSLKQWR
jgi:competence protein ComEC